MSTSKVSRRQMVSIVGAAVAIVPAIARGETGSFDRRASAESKEQPKLSSELIRPLQAGSVLGDWTIEKVGALHAGACTLEVSHRGSARFYLDICLKDDGIGALSPPARSSRCDLFIANEGNGSTATAEEQGLFAMAIAEVVRGNEMGLDLCGLLTLRDRLAQHSEKVCREAH